MNRFKRNRLIIRVDSPVFFISGPYTASTKEERDRNIAKADAVARDITELGQRIGLAVRCLVPHSLTGRWDDDPRWSESDSYNFFMQLCYSWIIDAADALYFVDPSYGSNNEKSLAKAVGVPVLESLDEVQKYLLNWVEVRRNANSLSFGGDGIGCGNQEPYNHLAGS